MIMQNKYLIYQSVNEKSIFGKMFPLEALKSANYMNIADSV
jgi:hypothetical protein